MAPPEGSKIRIETDSVSGFDKIVAPHGSGGVMRCFYLVFLLAWLCGWTVGWVAAFRGLFAKGGPEPFLIFWLVAWTVGGAFALFTVYRMLRPSVPEELVLSVPTLEHDTGLLPFRVTFGHRSQAEFWNMLREKRTKREFKLPEIRTLKLREGDSGNRLTLDCGADRIDLGVSLSEIEREWLYRILVEKYKLDNAV